MNQRGDPKCILLARADPYIENFISDINRARILCVKSIASPLTSENSDGDIDADSNPGRLIAKSGGDTNHIDRALENGDAIGQLGMRDLVKTPGPSLRSDPNEVAADV